jgi:hypothetical protein
MQGRFDKIEICESFKLGKNLKKIIGERK